MSNLTDLLPSGAGGKQVSFTATGAISAGQPVGLRSDGTVSVMEGGGGTHAEFSTARAEYLEGAFDPDTNQIVIAYKDNDDSHKGKVVVGTVSGTSITFGSPVLLDGGSSDARKASIVYDTGNNKMVVAWWDNSNDRGKAAVGTVTSGTISFGSTFEFEDSDAGDPNLAYDPDSGKTVVSFRDDNNSGYGAVIPLTVSGTSISGSTKTIYQSASLGYHGITYDTSADRIIVVYANSDDSSKGYARAGQISGDSYTFGTAVKFHDAQIEEVNIEFDSTNNKSLVVFRDQGNSGYTTGTVLSLSGSTVTAGTSVAIGSAVTQAYKIGIAFSPDSGKFIVVYGEAGNLKGFANLITVSGTSFTDEGQVTVATINESSYGFQYPAAVYDGNTDQFVITAAAWGSSDSVFAFVYTGGIDSSTFVGIADSAISNGATGKVTLKGGVATNSSLTTPLGVTKGTDNEFMTGSPTAATSVYDPDNNKVVMIMREGNIPKAKVGTVSGDAISFGAEVMPAGAINANLKDQSLAYDTGNDKLVFCYQDISNSYYGTAVVGTVSGTSTSWGTPVVYSSVNTGFNEVVYDSNAGKVGIFYKNQVNNRGTAVVGTVSGTSISYGTPVVFNTSNTNGFALAYDTNAQKIFVGINSGATEGKAYVATISGTDISFGSSVQFNSGELGGNDLAAAYDSTNQKVVLAYTDFSSEKGYIVVGTISGTSVSFGTAVQYAVSAADKPNYTSMAYNSTAQLINVFYNVGGGNGVKTTLASISGSTVTLESDMVNVLSTGNSESNTTVFDPDNGKFIILYYDTSSKAYASVLTTNNTLVAGSTYYIQSDGTISTTSSSVTAGKAYSSTSINLEYNS